MSMRRSDDQEANIAATERWGADVARVRRALGSTDELGTLKQLGILETIGTGSKEKWGVVGALFGG